MFQTTLAKYQSQLHLNPITSLSCLSTSTSSDIDLQYQLYSTYMHLSKQQIAIQELILMKDSQMLIESFNISGKADTSRDAHSTMDSLCYDEDFDNSIMHDFSAIEKRSPRKITRKSTRQSILKPIGRNGDEFTEILNEIQRNCTENAFITIKSLLQQHKKNLSKMVEVQKKQKNVRRLQEKTEKLEQQNAIFKIKLTEIQQKIKSKDDEIKGMRDKLNQLKMTDKQNIRSQKRLLSSATKSTTQDQRQSFTPPTNNPTITNYLEQKQSHLKQRMSKVQQIEARIQHLIESSVVCSEKDEKSAQEMTCNKCCQMIRKIKDSVMKYRQYLEEEGEQCEKLYNMLKAEVENCLTHRRIEIVNL